jgi:hypothetical protein
MYTCARVWPVVVYIGLQHSQLAASITPTLSPLYDEAVALLSVPLLPEQVCMSCQQGVLHAANRLDAGPGSNQTTYVHQG